MRNPLLGKSRVFWLKTIGFLFFSVIAFNVEGGWSLLYLFSLIVVGPKLYRKYRDHWAYLGSPEYKEKCRLQTIAELKEAIQLKEWIKISYAGGSQPNAVRKIFPLRISDDEKYFFGTNDKSDTEGAMFKIELLSTEPMSAEVDYEEFDRTA